MGEFKIKKTANIITTCVRKLVQMDTTHTTVFSEKIRRQIYLY